jgi:hypothetical protein
MLYYALSTLFKYYDNSFDIVIFQSMPDNFDFDKYQYMSKYSIKNDFNNLHIYESDYKSKYSYDYNEKSNSPWMSKWYNLYKVYQMQYKKVLMIDCDIIFFKNPAYIFDKYDSQYVWVLGCMDTIFSTIYKDKKSIMSGQILIDFDNIKLPDDFYELCVSERLLQQNMANNLADKFTQQELKNFNFFNEQYSAQIVLEKLGASYNYFMPEDLTTPANCNLENLSGNHVYDILCVNDEIVLDNIKTTIIHYAAGCIPYNLPHYLRDENLSYAYNTYWKPKICHS